MTCLVHFLSMRFTLLSMFIMLYNNDCAKVIKVFGKEKEFEEFFLQKAFWQLALYVLAKANMAFVYAKKHKK